MRAPALLLLTCLLAAGGEARLAQAQPATRPAAEAAAEVQVPAAESSPAEDPYRQRMTAGHRVQPPRYRSALTPQRVGQWKVALALAGTAVLLWGALAARGLETPGRRRLRDGALLALGAASIFAWTNFSTFHHPRFGHAADTYARYLGAKYFDELGYERLYLCAAVADVEAGRRAQVERRYPRAGARDGRVSAATAIEQPESCKARFTPERWTDFQRDVAWFRERESVRRWQEIQAGPGYVETPVWTALGGSLANRIPATDAGVLTLQLLDPLLLAAMWIAVALVFGWRAACVALLFWGTNQPAAFDATGGSFLRQGWLAASVAAICALRSARPALAGALLAVAIAFEGYASFVLAALALQALVARLGPQRFASAPAARRLLAAALVTAGAIFALSLVAGGGLPAWREWRVESSGQALAPVGNELGLARVVSAFAGPPAASAAPDGAPASGQHAAAPPAGRWIFLALLVGYLALLARVAAHAPSWVIGVLGLGGMLIASDVPRAASAGLLAFALLWPQRPAIGIALCLLSLAGWWIAGSGPATATVFERISLASVLFVAAVTALWLRPAAAAGDAATGDGAGTSLRPV